MNRIQLRRLRTQGSLNICLFTDSLEPSGLGEHMLALAAELLPHYRVLFVCPPTERGQKLLVRARQLGCSIMALNLDDEVTAYAVLESRLRRLAICVFHCHAGIGWEGQRAVYVARQAGVPVVIRTEHLPYLLTDQRQKRDHQKIWPLVDRFICVSAEAYTSYLQAGMPAARLCVIRNGIRAQPAQPDDDAVRAEFGLPPAARLVLTVARMTEQKGHKHLLDAIPTVIAHEPDAHFIWVGDGPLEGDLRRQAKELGIDDRRLIFAGWRGDVPRLMASSDLFVLPSLFEGLPIVILEAMAAGSAIVGTTVCGTREAIEDEVCGRLVPPANPAALATGIIEGLCHEESIARWREAARRKYQQLFTAARMGRETAEIYETAFAQQAWNLGGVRRPLGAPAAPFAVRPKPALTTGQAPAGHVAAPNQAAD
jgi:glycosyltransferase involved in cell wall biosynthesis